MAELVFQTWERITGRPWSDAAAGGFTDGSFDANIALQKKLLAGFDPFAPTTTTAPKTTTTTTKEATVATSTLLPIDPGLLAQQWEAMLNMEKYIADLQAEIASLDRAETGRIADLQAEIDRATLAQNQLQFEASLAFEVEKFGLSEKEFDFRVDQFRQQFGLQEEQFQFTKESFAKDFGLRREQFEADFGLRERAQAFEEQKFQEQFGLERERFAEDSKQFQQQFGLSVDEFAEAQRQFNQTFGAEQERFLAELGFSREQFAEATRQFDESFAFERERFGAEFGLERERFGLERTLAEAQLSANPSNFVALELYKRSLEEQGIVAPSGRGSIGDEGVQDLFATVLGLEGGATQGTGQFGVELPTPGAISRQQAGQFTESDLALLESFLRGGVDVGEGEFAGINPNDFFQEVQEGFIPTIDEAQQLTEVRF